MLTAAVGTPTLAQVELPQAVTDGSSITVEEVRAHSARVYAALAGQAGEAVPRAALVSVRLPPACCHTVLGKLFDLLDTDDDGGLKRAEWGEGINRDLEFADQNPDGRITLRELAHARHNMSLGNALDMVF